MGIQLIYQHFKRNDYQSHSDFRRSIEQHLKYVLPTRTVINNETGYTIGFNKTGIEKMVASIGDIKAIALCNLQPILWHAIFVEATADNKNRPDIIQFLLFKTPVNINGSNYEVWCYVRHRKDGLFLYSINIDAKNALG